MFIHTITQHKQSLASAGLSAVHLTAVGDRAIAHVPNYYMESFLSWAANTPIVRWVDQQEHFQLHNFNASQAIQSWSYQGWPLWWRGIDGRGQVVGFADTVCIVLVRHVRMSRYLYMYVMCW